MFKHHLTLALVCCLAPVATNGSSRAIAALMASGGGWWTDPAPIHGDEEVELLAFNAREIGEGLATGHIHYMVQTDGKLRFQSQIDVDWMLLDEINSVVFVGGTVVYDTDPQFVGTTTFFGLRDNGEGGNALPDERGPFLYSLDVGVEIDYELVSFLLETGQLPPPDEVLRPLDGGNYQVNFGANPPGLALGRSLSTAHAVPEPSVLLLAGVSLTTLLSVRRRLFVS